MRSVRFWILAGLALAVGVAVYLREPNPVPAGPSSGALEAQGDEDSEGREHGITLSDIPEPARSVILAEAGGHELVEVEQVISFRGGHQLNGQLATQLFDLVAKQRAGTANSRPRKAA